MDNGEVLLLGPGGVPAVQYELLSPPFAPRWLSPPPFLTVAQGTRYLSWLANTELERAEYSRRLFIELGAPVSPTPGTLDDEVALSAWLIGWTRAAVSAVGWTEPVSNFWETESSNEEDLERERFDDPESERFDDSPAWERTLCSLAHDLTFVVVADVRVVRPDREWYLSTDPWPGFDPPQPWNFPALNAARPDVLPTAACKLILGSALRGPGRLHGEPTDTEWSRWRTSVEKALPDLYRELVYGVPNPSARSFRDPARGT